MDSILVILFLFFLFSTPNYFMFTLGMNIICKQNEKTALLSFKQHLIDPTDSLSSWSSENCCSWSGVVCSNRTHHVIRLHLQELGLGGELNPSLKELTQLRLLDLSLNDFDGINIPSFLGSLQSLRYLNLSRAGFSGMIPHQLGNLSNLHYLDLGSSAANDLTVVGNFHWISHLSSLQHLDLSFVNLRNTSSHQLGNLSNLRYLDLRNSELTVVGNFQWISHLSSLQHLDLSFVNLRNASSNLFHAVNMLPSLFVLRLSSCGLSGALPSSLQYVNFTSLAVLDLSWNLNLNSTLPEWLYSLTNLEQLDLSSNSFQGTISASIGNLTKLTLLDLSYNELQGEIPITLGNLCKLLRLDLRGNKLKGEISGFLGRLKNLNVLSLGENQFSGPIPLSIGRLSLLETLDLRHNKLNGSLPESLGNLSKLGTLDITKNAFEGVVVSEVHFANLTNLQYLSMDSLVLKMSPEWVPPFQLVTADLGTCRLGPGFPIWLRTQKNITSLYLSKTGISGTIPTWFWNFTTNPFITFDLSHNELYGVLPKVINATTLTLKSNQFSGQLPRVAPNVQQLVLSNNSFSGSISTLLCNPSSSISENNYLLILDLSDNLLSGSLSDCWVYWTSLMTLSLEGNKITGNIPNSMSSLLYLEQLHLSNNNLSGELPSSLRNCTSLSNIDLGENGFTGRLPIWLGESSLSGLQYLRLRSNKFYGEIPLALCHLASIQVLDIAHNDLRGSIPRCFNNFSALTTIQHSSGGFSTNVFGEYVEKTKLVVKGRERDYSSIGRELVTSLDLSKNSLSGEIPEELTSLIGLRLFNLSDNYFTGKIPEKMGDMVLLESLDFSNNNISGVIPQSISGLYSLGHLNLSYNNLSGKIPSSTQLQSFNESSFVGNEDLCGLPLSKCNGEVLPPQKPSGDTEVEEDEDWFEMKWFYMSMGVGFVFGFWVFCGVIVLKGSWRIAYFRFLDDMKDKLCLLF